MTSAGGCRGVVGRKRLEQSETEQRARVLSTTWPYTRAGISTDPGDLEIDPHCQNPVWAGWQDLQEALKIRPRTHQRRSTRARRRPSESSRTWREGATWVRVATVATSRRSDE